MNRLGFAEGFLEALTRVSDGLGAKTPDDVGGAARGPMRRRHTLCPEYSSSGCVPAEPDSASPGNSIVANSLLRGT